MSELANVDYKCSTALLNDIYVIVSYVVTSYFKSLN